MPVAPDPTPEAPTPPVQEQSWPEVDRRRGDRRARPTRLRDTFWGPRRRGGGRRAEDHGRLYVDRYEARDLALVLAVFLLNLLDAVLTLVWLRRGGREGNPLMELMLEAGHETFLYEKCFLVGFWLILLVMHKNFRVARLGLWGLLIVYALLFGWHLVLWGQPTAC